MRPVPGNQPRRFSLESWLGLFVYGAVHVVSDTRLHNLVVWPLITFLRVIVSRETRCQTGRFRSTGRRSDSLDDPMIADRSLCANVPASSAHGERGTRWNAMLAEAGRGELNYVELNYWGHRAGYPNRRTYLIAKFTFRVDCVRAELRVRKRAGP